MHRLALLGLLLPLPALAAPLPTIAVVGLHQDSLTPDQQERASTEIAEAIDDSHFYQARVLGDLEPNLHGREQIILDDAFLGPGRALLDDGRLLYNSAQPDEAVPILTDATKVLRLAMATATTTRDLWDAWFLLGASYNTIGRPKEARRAFEQAIAVEPLRSPDAARYPPSLIQRYEAIRKERLQLASVLTVTADERDTRIWLNGEERGTVPLTLTNVVPGDNYVHARSPHGFFAYEAVHVPEAGQKRVDLRLGEPTLGYPAEGRVARSRQVTGLYRSLGRRLGVDLVLLGGTVGDNLVLQLYSPRSDGFSQPLSIPCADACGDEAVDALPELLAGVREDGTFEDDNHAALAAPLDVGANHWLARALILPPRAEAPETAKKMPRWLTWTLTGVGAAAVVGGTAWGVSWALTDPDQGKVIVLPP